MTMGAFLTYVITLCKRRLQFWSAFVVENGVFSAAVNGGAEDSVMGSGLP